MGRYEACQEGRVDVHGASGIGAGGGGSDWEKEEKGTGECTEGDGCGRQEGRGCGVVERESHPTTAVDRSKSRYII
jgi:hypothetical protein